MASHLDTGVLGERYAAQYLQKHGFRILEHRYRSGRTDIDLIACGPEGRLHPVEVKTRTVPDARSVSSFFASDFSPAAAVTPAKLRRMIAAAEEYMQRTGKEAEAGIDLVSVLLISSPPSVEIRYFPDIFRG